MRSFRLPLLVLILLGALGALYHHVESAVRTETVQFNSKLIGKTLPYSVVLPPGYGLFTSWRKHYPVLYLLHGWSGHYNSWLDHTLLAQYASEHQLIIVTPEGNNGWYTDGAVTQSDKHPTYAPQELTPDPHNRLPTIPDRPGPRTAAYSIAGYGALNFGFNHPHAFT